MSSDGSYLPHGAPLGPGSRNDRLKDGSPSRVEIVRIEGLRSGYGSKLVIHDVSLSIGRGEIVAVLGHNGAGKSTLLKTVFGLVRPFDGSIAFDSETGWLTPRRNRQRGMAFIPAEEFVFGGMTVAENLSLGSIVTRSTDGLGDRTRGIRDLFPVLSERRKQLAGTLSGGQQRMLILAMSLLAGPKLLLLDEPSLGLSPILVEEIFGRLRGLADEEGLGVLLVEQNVDAVLRVADRICIMRSGQIVRELESNEMRGMDRTEWWTLF